MPAQAIDYCRFVVYNQIKAQQRGEQKNEADHNGR
jgi:hypothetical protein